MHSDTGISYVLKHSKTGHPVLHSISKIAAVSTGHLQHPVLELLK